MNSSDHKALVNEKLEDGSIRCHLCAHRCLIRDGRLGVCKVNQNRGGSGGYVGHGLIGESSVETMDRSMGVSSTATDFHGCAVSIQAHHYLRIIA